MFILKRQDVDIKQVQHPSKDQKIPILSYQGQTFRLLSVFTASQEDEARALWRDLTDNRGKACVLLEEPERYSIWGKVRLDQLDLGDLGGEESQNGQVVQASVQACLLLLQALYIDIEDLLGAKQVSLFEQEVTAVFTKWRFPQATSAKAVNALLTVDPLAIAHVPPWHEQHLTTLLQELHRIGRDYFGNTNFTERVMEALEDLPAPDRQTFVNWLRQSDVAGLWQ